MPPATRRKPISPARQCAFTVLLRVFEQGAYADRAFAAQARALDPRDRALAMQLSYGAVQRRGTLDHVAQRLLNRPLGDIEPPVRAALALGLFQVLYLGGVAAHAAVHESVELAKRVRPAAAGLVNAVLRRATAEGPAILADLHDRDPDAAAVLYSVPAWLARRWWRELGAETARQLLRHVNEPAESVLRVNTLVATPHDALAALAVPAVPAAGVPEGLVLEGGFDAHGSEAWRRGAIMPQSRGSMLVARTLAPVPGDRVLDLCAAPGAKTTQLAALMGDRGTVTAVERHRGRAQALQRTCARMHASCVRVEVADAASHRRDTGFDRVLVDPPCSGLGTLQSRPDLRWRAGPKQIEQLAALQSRILEAAAAATGAGGVLVYSVCTISCAEGQRVVDQFLREHRDFEAGDLGCAHPQWADAAVGPYLQLLPHREGTDGFFIARLERLPGLRADRASAVREGLRGPR
jgi:16S rRNA (cytosine967-C5)-methyltransferase